MDSRVNRIFDKYNFPQWKRELNPDNIYKSNRHLMELMSLKEHIIILGALWESMREKGFSALSGKLKLRIVNNWKRLVALPEFLKGTIRLSQFNYFLKQADFSEAELSELWSIFHKLNPGFSNRSINEIDKHLQVNKIILGKLKLFGRIHVLDLGCGNSAYAISELASRYGDKVKGYGIDLAVNEAPKNVTVVKGTIREMPFSDNSFDVIYSYRVLMYFHERELPLILNEVYRVLKRGGIFVCDEAPNIIKKYFLGKKIKIKGSGVACIIVKD